MGVTDSSPLLPSNSSKKKGNWLEEGRMRAYPDDPPGVRKWSAKEDRGES